MPLAVDLDAPEHALCSETLASRDAEVDRLKRMLTRYHRSEIIEAATEELPSLGMLTAELKKALKDYTELAVLRTRCNDQRRQITMLQAALTEMKRSTSPKVDP